MTLTRSPKTVDIERRLQAAAVDGVLPHGTLAAIARLSEVALTTERVRQIAKRLGLHHKKGGAFERVCSICGNRKQVDGRYRASPRICLNCYNHQATTWTCALCGDQFTLSGVLRTCREAYRRKRAKAGKPPPLSFCPACAKNRRSLMARMDGAGRRPPRDDWRSL